MYHLSLTYDEVLNHHSEEILFLIDNLRNSGTKSSDIPIEKIKWRYIFDVRLQSPMEMIMKMMGGETPKLLFTLEEKVNDFIERVGSSIYLEMKAGRIIRTVTIPVSPLFKEKVIQEFTLQEKEIEKQMKRLFDSMGSEKDFMSFIITPDGVKPLMSDDEFDMMVKNNMKPIEYDLDEILDKISKNGLKSLTEEEKKWLDSHSKK